MKKLLCIVALGLLLSGKAISEEISLLCFTKTEKEPATLIIDTKKQKAFWQARGSGNTYNLNNGIFKYTVVAKDLKTHFRHTLNRFTGILTVEFFEFEDEKVLKKFMESVKIRLDAAGKSTNDIKFFFKLYYEELGNVENDFVLKFDCEKSEKKF